MRADFRHRRYPRTWRVCHIAFMLLVLCYIFFDGLDLDESYLLALEAPEETSLIAAEVTPDLELAGPSDPAQLWENTALYEDRSRECIRLQKCAAPRSSPLDLARSRGYRVGLPRDSITDLPPSA
ncbi:MAG TPA: hypothetical protein VGL11_04430 [Candidatus Binatia bacterium]|jgi:hypothetical protein